MSVDTNLHRTFDYQLSPASLRIIDWAPVKAVAAAVTQSGAGATTYGLVHSASPHEATTAAAYVRQESARQEALQARNASAPAAASEGVTTQSTEQGPSNTSMPGGGGPSSPSTLLSPCGQPDASAAAAATAASPCCTPGASVAMSAEAAEDCVALSQPGDFTESWTGDGKDSASGASPSGGLFFPHSTSPTPVPASAALADNNGAVVSAPAHAMHGGAGTSVSNVNAPASSSGHSGTATPKTAAAVGATPRVGSPASPSLTPTLARYTHRLSAAGNMYGFDSVYQNGSFGILLGLFTGVGYQQTNVVYRREEWGSSRNTSGSGGGRRGAAAVAEPATASSSAAAAAGAAAGSCSGSASNSMNNRSPSDGYTTAPAAGAADLTNAAAGVSEDAKANGEGAGAAAGAPPEQRARVGPVVAYKKVGGFQLSNAIQCCWYWGARRWMGVVNLRFTPLLPGDAILPVCECVTRTEITETSILIDDPVIYAHSFVVLLGRRKRTPDDVPSLMEEASVERISVAANESTHPLALAAVAHVGEATDVLHRRTQQRDDSAAAAGDEKPSATPTGESRANRASARATSSGGKHASAEGTATLASVLQPGEKGHPSASATGPSGASSVNKALTSSTSSASTSESLHHPVAATPCDDSTTMLPWYYWYQRCMMDTSDEWLWSRAASEVAADIARSTTPWWKLRRVKTGVGLSYRYRKPCGINVYWGWSAQLGRGTSVSGHVDVLRRMSCSISSSFGYLDVSVRLRVNLVTLHQTALDAGLCWRPLPHVPDVALRVASSANGTTVGLEMADVAPWLYAPVVDRLARYRAGKKEKSAGLRTGSEAAGAEAVASTTADTHRAHQQHTSPAERLSAVPTQQALRDSADGTREDLVGLLPVTWHYLCGLGTTITHAYSGVAGAVASTWRSNASDAAPKDGERHHTPPPPPLPVPPAFPHVPASPSLAPHPGLAGMAAPVGRAGLRYLRDAYSFVADLGWLESMLRTSHVNVSMGITAEPGKLGRDWSFFFILSEK